MRHVVASLLLLVAVLLSSSDVPAETLTGAENARLARGETVEREEALDLRGGHYVGGVTYTVINASPGELDALFEDVSTYPHILPHTKDARLVGRDRDELLVWVRQGNTLLDASYTIRVRLPPNDPRTVRFWLDRSRPHGIDDAFGFFRCEPQAPASSGRPRVLLTFAIWVDIGPGIVRALFERQIQHIVLTVPQRVRAYFDRSSPRPR